MFLLFVSYNFKAVKGESPLYTFFFTTFGIWFFKMIENSSITCLNKKFLFTYSVQVPWGKDEIAPLVGEKRFEIVFKEAVVLISLRSISFLN